MLLILLDYRFNLLLFGLAGTFIAVDQLTRMSDDRSLSELDVFNHVYNLRRERRYMVQTAEQYAYVYKCLRSYMMKKKKEAEEEVGA